MTRAAYILTLPVSMLLALSPAAALAQARTGIGGGPDTTATAPNTTSVGQTKPPGGGGGGAEPRSDARTQQERADDKISRGICIGCSLK